MKTGVEVVSEIPDPEAKDEIQQIKLCISTSSAKGIWKRDATLLDLSRLFDQVDELWEEEENLRYSTCPERCGCCSNKVKEK